MLKTQNLNIVNPTPPPQTNIITTLRDLPQAKLRAENKLKTFIKYIDKGWDTALFKTASPASRSTHLVRIPQVIISVLREPMPICFGVQEGFTEI